MNFPAVWQPIIDLIATNTPCQLGILNQPMGSVFMSNFSLDYCIDEFMIYCRSRDLRRRTLDSYEHTLRLFERWCEVGLKIDRIHDVSEQVIRRYITNLQERGKYTFYADEKSRGTSFPERRRDYRQPVTTATVTYIMNAQIGFNMSWTAAYIVGTVCAAAYLVGIIMYGKKRAAKIKLV